MRFLSLIVFTLFICSMPAQNNLRLLSAQGQLFKVRQNGQLADSLPQASILLEHISVDTLNLQLEFENSAAVPCTFYLLDRGQKINNQEFNYRVEPGPPVKAVFTGLQDIASPRKPLVPAKPVVDTTIKYNNKLMGHFCELKDGKPVYFNNLPSKGHCTQPMPGEYMNYVGQLMRRAATDDARFAVIENVCRNNCLSVEQLNGLTAYIGYEIEKLKLVRIAYFNLTDTVNRQKLASGFRFESSVNELKEFFAHTGDYRQRQAGHCQQASDSSQVNLFIREIALPKTDPEKFNLFKKNYDQYCYDLGQVRQLLQLFLHDREKLDVAKLLYPYCTERGNYASVNDIFSYNETAAELRNFMIKQAD